MQHDAMAKPIGGLVTYTPVSAPQIATKTEYTSHLYDVTVVYDVRFWKIHDLKNNHGVQYLLLRN